MTSALALTLVLSNARAADLEIHIEVAKDGYATTVVASDVDVGVSLPAVTIVDSDGAQIVVTANLLGVVDGQAVVQLDGSRRSNGEGGDESVDDIWMVAVGTTSWSSWLKEFDQAFPTSTFDWISMSVTQSGELPSTIPGDVELSLLLPHGHDLIFLGDLLDEIGVAERLPRDHPLVSMGSGPGGVSGEAGEADVTYSSVFFASDPSCEGMERVPAPFLLVNSPSLVPPAIQGHPEQRAILSLSGPGRSRNRRLVSSGACSFNTGSGERMRLLFSVERI